jgi:hypothetical protein
MNRLRLNHVECVMRPASRFFVAYNCPHCGVAIEAEDDSWDGWRRCPACARPALPPKLDPELRRRQEYDVDRQSNGEREPGTDGPEDPIGSNSEGVLQIQRPASPVIGPARLIFKTGFFLSLALLLISYLDQRSMNTVIFGALAVIFFLLLLRFPSKRRAKEGPQP